MALAQLYGELLSSVELVALLELRGGQEHKVSACFYVEELGKRKKIAPTLLDKGTYILTMRGIEIEATGPSGQTRLMSKIRFLEVFESLLFRNIEATGRLTDLGPLYDM